MKKMKKMLYTAAAIASSLSMFAGIGMPVHAWARYVNGEDMWFKQDNGEWEKVSNWHGIQGNNSDDMNALHSYLQKSLPEGISYNSTAAWPYLADAYSKYEQNDLPARYTENFSNHFESKEGKTFWYENGIRQGDKYDSKGVKWKNDGKDAPVRGREIYDAASDAWYWLDANADGAKAVGKEVFMPYVYQNESTMSAEDLQKNAEESDAGMVDYVADLMKSGTGKWVRYDENGKMLKGWITIEGALAEVPDYKSQIGNKYYYDTKTGAMAKGWLTIDGKLRHFDETSGKLLN